MREKQSLYAYNLCERSKTYMYNFLNKNHTHNLYCERSKTYVYNFSNKNLYKRSKLMCVIFIKMLCTQFFSKKRLCTQFIRWRKKLTSAAQLLVCIALAIFLV
jgi:hypothetical protein